MKSNEFDEKVLTPIKTKGLVISRIPKVTRDEFVKFAEDFYADDYGMLLVELWNRYKEHMNILQGIDVKINYLSEMIQSLCTEEKEEKPPTSELKMLDGRRVKGGEKNE